MLRFMYVILSLWNYRVKQIILSSKMKLDKSSFPENILPENVRSSFEVHKAEEILDVLSTKMHFSYNLQCGNRL